MESFESDRIIYRDITLDDTEKVLKWRNCDEVRNNFFYQVIITEQEHIEYYKTRIAVGETRQFVMIDKASEMEFGCVYLSHIDLNAGTAEEGIFIGEDTFRGSGYGTEAYRWLKEFGFKELGLNSICLRIRKENIASKKSAQNAGFIIDQKLVDKYYEDGGTEDLIFLSDHK